MQHLYGSEDYLAQYSISNLAFSNPYLNLSGKGVISHISDELLINSLGKAWRFPSSRKFLWDRTPYGPATQYNIKDNPPLVVVPPSLVQDIQALLASSQDSVRGPSRGGGVPYLTARFEADGARARISLSAGLRGHEAHVCGAPDRRPAASALDQVSVSLALPTFAGEPPAKDPSLFLNHALAVALDRPGPPCISSVFAISATLNFERPKGEASHQQGHIGFGGGFGGGQTVLFASTIATLDLVIRVPVEELQATQLFSKRLSDTPLAQRLATGAAGGGLMCGFLTMDRARCLVPLAPATTEALSAPLVGVWISGAASPAHPLCYAAAAAFQWGAAVRDRAVPPDGAFLLLLFGIGPVPSCFECRFPNTAVLPSAAAFTARATIPSAADAIRKRLDLAAPLELTPVWEGVGITNGQCGASTPFRGGGRFPAQVTLSDISRGISHKNDVVTKSIDQRSPSPLPGSEGLDERLRVRMDEAEAPPSTYRVPYQDGVGASSSSALGNRDQGIRSLSALGARGEIPTKIQEPPTATGRQATAEFVDDSRQVHPAMYADSPPVPRMFPYVPRPTVQLSSRELDDLRAKEAGLWDSVGGPSPLPCPEASPLNPSIQSRSNLPQQQQQQLPPRQPLSGSRGPGVNSVVTTAEGSVSFSSVAGPCGNVSSAASAPRNCSSPEPASASSEPCVSAWAFMPFPIQSPWLDYDRHQHIDPHNFANGLKSAGHVNSSISQSTNDYNLLPCQTTRALSDVLDTSGLSFSSQSYEFRRELQKPPPVPRVAALRATADQRSTGSRQEPLHQSFDSWLEQQQKQQQQGQPGPPKSHLQKDTGNPDTYGMRQPGAQHAPGSDEQLRRDVDQKRRQEKKEGTGKEEARHHHRQVGMQSSPSLKQEHKEGCCIVGGEGVKVPFFQRGLERRSSPQDQARPIPPPSVTAGGTGGGEGGERAGDDLTALPADTQQLQKEVIFLRQQVLLLQSHLERLLGHPLAREAPQTLMPSTTMMAWARQDSCERDPNSTEAAAHSTSRLIQSPSTLPRRCELSSHPTPHLSSPEPSAAQASSSERQSASTTRGGEDSASLLQPSSSIRPTPLQERPLKTPSKRVRKDPRQNALNEPSGSYKSSGYQSPVLSTPTTARDGLRVDAAVSAGQGRSRNGSSTSGNSLIRSQKTDRMPDSDPEISTPASRTTVLDARMMRVSVAASVSLSESGSGSGGRRDGVPAHARASLSEGRLAALFANGGAAGGAIHASFERTQRTVEMLSAEGRAGESRFSFGRSGGAEALEAVEDEEDEALFFGVKKLTYSPEGLAMGASVSLPPGFTTHSAKVRQAAGHAGRTYPTPEVESRLGSCVGIPLPPADIENISVMAESSDATLRYDSAVVAQPSAGSLAEQGQKSHGSRDFQETFHNTDNEGSGGNACPPYLDARARGSFQRFNVKQLPGRDQYVETGAIIGGASHSATGSTPTPLKRRLSDECRPIRASIQENDADSHVAKETTTKAWDPSVSRQLSKSPKRSPGEEPLPVAEAVIAGFQKGGETPSGNFTRATHAQQLYNQLGSSVQPHQSPLRTYPPDHNATYIMQANQPSPVSSVATSNVRYTSELLSPGDDVSYTPYSQMSMSTLGDDDDDYFMAPSERAERMCTAKEQEEVALLRIRRRNRARAVVRVRSGLAPNEALPGTSPQRTSLPMTIASVSGRALISYSSDSQMWHGAAHRAASPPGSGLKSVVASPGDAGTVPIARWTQSLSEDKRKGSANHVVMPLYSPLSQLSDSPYSVYSSGSPLSPYVSSQGAFLRSMAQLREVSAKARSVADAMDPSAQQSASARQRPDPNFLLNSRKFSAVPDTPINHFVSRHAGGGGSNDRNLEGSLDYVATSSTKPGPGSGVVSVAGFTSTAVVLASEARQGPDTDSDDEELEMKLLQKYKIKI